MRLQANELTPEHHNRLVTVSDETGQSITMTLTRITADDGQVIIRGRALGQSRGVVLEPTAVVHLYGDQDDTAVAAAVGVLHDYRPTIVHRSVRPGFKPQDRP